MNIFSLYDIFGPIGPMFATFLLGFATFLLALGYSMQKQTYWKRLGVPYIKPLPFFGSLLDVLRKPGHELELDRYNKFGKIYGGYECNRPILSVAEPEILRSIFVKDFQVFSGRRTFDFDDKLLQSMLSVLHGDDWKRVRTIVSPTFTTGKIRRMLDIFKDCSWTLVKNFQVGAEKGEPVEINSLYGAFTMDVIASSAFSTKIDSHNDPNNEFTKRAQQGFQSITLRIIAFVLFPGVMKFFGISILHPKCKQFFTDVISQIVEERKRTGQTRNDFLQLLMDTEKEASETGKLDISEKEGDIADNYGKEEGDIVFKNISSKKTLSKTELVAQCVLFLLAGYETTATVLSFTTYLLALNPDAQEKVIQELDDALKNNNGELTYEAIQSLKYLDNVISETLRLYPPNVRLDRVADVNYKLADTGITVPKGMIVSIPVYAMHMDPKFFPDPEKFDPDRFLPEERAKRNPYTYLPFGAGPRNCVAMRFALMEIKVCLACVLSVFRIKRCSKTKVPLQFKVNPGFKAKDITVLFEIRESAVNAV